MRLVFGAVLVLIIAVLVALLAQEDPGYVLIARGDWSVESSLILLGVVVLLAFLLFHWGLLLFTGVRRAPGRLLGWGRNRHSRRARRGTQRGLIALAEGRWKQAERQLIRAANDSAVPLINYLGAARAAQEQDSDERRDDHLARALRSMPEAELAVGLSQAELQLDHGQNEQALATLVHLRSIEPRHEQVLLLLMRLYRQLGSWQDVLDLLPELRKRGLIDERDAVPLERETSLKLMERASRDIKNLEQVWTRMPSALRQQAKILAGYVQHRLALDGGKDCEVILRQALRRDFDAELMRLYGLVADGDPGQRLATVETWLKEMPQQPDVLLCAGRLALRAELWGMARQYLEAAVNIRPDAEIHCELGRLLQQLDEPQLAAGHFEQGLALAVGEHCSQNAKGNNGI